MLYRFILLCSYCIRPNETAYTSRRLKLEMKLLHLNGVMRMWEIPFYIILAPILTVSISLVSTRKFNNYWFAPLFLFVVLNIPTVILPIMYHVGWEALLGWAFVYTVVSILISLVVWRERLVRRVTG